MAMVRYNSVMTMMYPDPCAFPPRHRTAQQCMRATFLLGPVLSCFVVRVLWFVVVCVGAAVKCGGGSRHMGYTCTVLFCL